MDENKVDFDLNLLMEFAARALESKMERIGELIDEYQKIGENSYPAFLCENISKLNPSEVLQTMELLVSFSKGCKGICERKGWTLDRKGDEDGGEEDR